MRSTLLIKTTVIFAVIFLNSASNSLAQQGWFILTSTIESSTGNTIVFPSQDTGYFCGGAYDAPGFYKKTVDGGKTWNDVNISFLSYPRLTFFIDSQIGFVLDGNPSYSILRTTDGGNLWRRYSIGDTSLKNFLGLYFVTPAIGFISGDGDSGRYNAGVLLRTIDSGKTWTNILSNTFGYFGQINFRDSLSGYLKLEYYQPYVGGELWATTDGGSHWYKTKVSDGYDKYYSKSLNVWIGMASSGIIRWKEDGSYSQYIGIIDPNGISHGEEITSMSFCNDTIGYVITRHAKIFKTIDGGISWFVQGSPKGVHGQLWDIVSPSEDVAYAVGDSVIIKTIDGGGPPVDNVERLNSSLSIQLSPNPATNYVNIELLDTLSPQNVEICDALGRLLLKTTLVPNIESFRVDVSNYSIGIYFVRIGVTILRFIKQ